MARLAGKIAVITGGASGIGLASAVLFAREGAEVAIVDRDAGGLAAAALAIAAAGAVPMTLAGDVGSEAMVEEHTDQILGRHGRIDILLTCAGHSTGKPVPQTTLAEWDSVMRSNLTGTFLWARSAVPAMREAGGSLIFVSSQLAFAGGRANAAYLASKGAVVSLARGMAVDHAPDGIRVNVLVPGAIDTPLLKHSFARSGDAAGASARSIARHPLGRLGRAEECAKAALFLASDDASFTTGSCLMVDGGWLAG
jgi:2-keto-3-deoxy-L-fuconate dehydrogenase